MIRRIIRHPTTILILVFFILNLGAFLLKWPTLSELIVMLRGFYERYGVITVLIGSFIEGLFVLNLYFPGSMVALLGAIFSEDLFQLTNVILFGTIGFSAGNLIDYALGKFGLYALLAKFGSQEPLEQVSKRLSKGKNKFLVVSLLLPPTAAIASTAAGILHYPFWRFFLVLLPTLLLRDTFWGVLAYSLGLPFIRVIGSPVFTVLFVVIIVTWIVVSERKKKRA